MINDQYKILIEQQLNDKFDSVKPLAETRVSSILVLIGKQKYIFKLSKLKPLHNHFENHKKIFNLWAGKKALCDFRISEPVMLGPEGRFMVIEYVDGENLLTKLTKDANNVDSLFERTGRGLKQYHALLTQEILDNIGGFDRCKKMTDFLWKKDDQEMLKHLSEFPSECERGIFRDFTPTNVIISQTDEIYFCDLQEAFYSGPLYYDIARFIDTTKVFNLIKTKSLFNRPKRAREAIDAFLTGYGNDIELVLLRKMQAIHRKDHIRFKKATNPFRGLILKILYKVV